MSLGWVHQHQCQCVCRTRFMRRRAYILCSGATDRAWAAKESGQSHRNPLLSIPKRVKYRPALPDCPTKRVPRDRECWNAGTNRDWSALSTWSPAGTRSNDRHPIVMCGISAPTRAVSAAAMSPVACTRTRHHTRHQTPGTRRACSDEIDCVAATW